MAVLGEGVRAWLHGGKLAFAIIDGRRVQIRRVRKHRGVTQFESCAGVWIDGLDVERIEFERLPEDNDERDEQHLAGRKTTNTARVNRYNEKANKEAK